MSLHQIHLAKALKNPKSSFCLTPLWTSNTAQPVKTKRKKEKKKKTAIKQITAPSLDAASKEIF